MALTPDFVKYGEASLTATSAAGGTATLTATHNNGTTWPNAHVETTSITVNVTEVTAGTGPPSPNWGIAVVEDATDASGNYTVTGAVLAWVSIGTAPTPATPIVITGLNKGGTYRLVVTAGNSAANSQNINNVTTGATSTEYHFDSDDNSLRGALAPLIGTTRVGVAGHRMEATAITPTAGNWKYGQTNQIAVSLRPAGDNAAALINPKNFKVVLSTDAAGSTRPDGTYSVTPNTTGDATATNIRVDTDFNQTLGGVAHYVQLGVNNTLGDNSTPTGERADIYQVAGATQEGTNTNQRSAIIFADGATTTVISDSQVRSDTADVTISAAIQIFEDAGLVTPGVAPFATSGYTTRQDIFKRTGAVNTTNAIPYMETYVFDAYGNPLPNTSFVFATKRSSNNSTENSQTLSTDANGRRRWNYTILANYPAFNRFVKAAAARVSGSHVANGPDDPNTPPSTFSIGNGVYTGPFPAYERYVVVTGNAFAGAKEPSVTDSSVFGVNSEIIIEGMWTGTVTNALLDSNGVPTGPGQREQTLGAGSLRAKTSTLIDEGNVRVIDINEFNPKDIAGRNIDFTGAEELKLARALFNDTLDTVIDAGSILTDAQHALDNPLGYSDQGQNSLDSIAPPTDPAGLLYWQGFADTTGQRGTFALSVSGVDPVIGFTGDAGNFGHKRQAIGFIAVDLTIKCVLNAEVAQSDPTLPRRFTVKVVRVTPDDAIVDVEPDSAPIYAVYGQPSTGGMVLIEEGVASPIGAPPTPDWDFTINMPLPSPIGYDSIKIIAFAKVQGSRTAGGSESTVQIGFEFDAVDFAVGIPSK